MKSSDLNKFLLSISSGEDLQRLIQEEVVSYHKLMAKKGSSIPLIFQEDEEVIINNSAMKTLFQETISGRLSNIHLAYLCDCLTLGEIVHFENERAEDVIWEIADPEINGGFKSNAELERIIEQTDN